MGHTIDKRIGKIINNYKIIKDSERRTRSRQIIYEVECLVCHRHFFLRFYDIEHETRWNTKEYLCPHISITKLGGYNDLHGFTQKGQPKINRRIYTLWQGILERTSPDFWEKCPTYKGTMMDPRWRTLYFCRRNKTSRRI